MWLRETWRLAWVGEVESQVWQWTTVYAELNSGWWLLHAPALLLAVIGCSLVVADVSQILGKRWDQRQAFEHFVHSPPAFNFRALLQIWLWSDTLVWDLVKSRTRKSGLKPCKLNWTWTFSASVLDILKFVPIIPRGSWEGFKRLSIISIPFVRHTMCKFLVLVLSVACGMLSLWQNLIEGMTSLLFLS